MQAIAVFAMGEGVRFRSVTMPNRVTTLGISVTVRQTSAPLWRSERTALGVEIKTVSVDNASEVSTA